MNVACPSCQHDTHVEQGIGDFPTRCIHCFTLLRLSAEISDGPRARSLRLESAGPVRRAPKGELAALLLTRPQMIAVAAGIASPGVAMFVDDAQPQENNGNAISEMLRFARACRPVAQSPRRQNQEALGTFGWIGLGAVFVLTIIAIAIRVQSLVNLASSPQTPAHGPVVLTSPIPGE